MDCIFCKIANGEIPSAIVYNDDLITAFKDLNPQAKVHILVVPKAHIASADEVDASNSAVVAHIFESIPKITKSVGITEGYRVITNVGKHGCQSVKHMHFHILGGEQLSDGMGGK